MTFVPAGQAMQALAESLLPALSDSYSQVGKNNIGYYQTVHAASQQVHLSINVCIEMSKYIGIIYNKHTHCYYNDVICYVTCVHQHVIRDRAGAIRGRPAETQSSRPAGNTVGSVCISRSATRLA